MGSKIVSPKLLIINCPSEYFAYIPMGSFGLCDYLHKRGIEVRILNLSLYRPSEMEEKLDHYLDLFDPTHIGLIFHWQDTAEGFLWAGERSRLRRPDARILAGGFTAGYFGENLLRKCGFLDYVIKGDAEKPVELLLRGVGEPDIPNILYRTASGAASSEITYRAGRKTLSGLSFANLACLYDHELYMEAAEKKLGFPLFIGRGCRFSCGYCGGSRGAFGMHSGTSKPVVRTIESIIADLRRLKDFTRTIYICYENDRNYIKDLFKAIQADADLVKVFRLNYGAWALFDEEFLDLYRETFVLSPDERPVLELSPEVYDDESRKKVKKGAFHYTLRELRENLNLVNSRLGNEVRTSVFFSRYHDTIRTYEDMRREILGIFRFKRDLILGNAWNAAVSYDHLSTDVGSRYWERYIDSPKDFDTLISGTRKLRIQEQFGFSFDNLCLYIPKTLTTEEVFRSELLIFVLRTLERSCYEMFHILFSCLDAELIDAIEEIINSLYKNRYGNVFRNMDIVELLTLLKARITGEASLLNQVPFADDLLDLCIRKAQCVRAPHEPKSGYQTERPKLNNQFISAHYNDYLNLPAFLHKLKKGPDKLVGEMTVFIFLIDEIMSMTYDTYNFTIREFEKGISVEEYHQLMNKKGIFTPSYHEDLIARLFQSDVLY
ncbi:MAG: hypothetical protein AB1442_00405 [Nitrospirota bacterium]